MMIAAVDQDDIDISVPQRACCGDSGKAGANDDNALSLLVGSLDDGSCPVRSGLGQHRVHGSPRSCSMSLTASASFCRKRCSQRSRQGSLRHTGSREAAILQCAGLLGAVTVPCASGFTVIKSIAKHIAAMTNVTTLKTCFMGDSDAVPACYGLNGSATRVCSSRAAQAPS